MKSESKPKLTLVDLLKCTSCNRGLQKNRNSRWGLLAMLNARVAAFVYIKSTQLPSHHAITAGIVLIHCSSWAGPIERPR